MRVFATALILVLAGAAPALAGGTGVSVAIGVSSGPGSHHHNYRGHRPWGSPWGARAYRYRPHYGGVRLYHYAPPPVLYAAPAPGAIMAGPPICRRYVGDAVIDASGQPFFGTACLRADGRWHIVE